MVRSATRRAARPLLAGVSLAAVLAGFGHAVLAQEGAPVGAGEPKGMPQLDFGNPLLLSQVVWGAVIFVLFYLLCARWVLPRMGAVIEARQASIAGDLETARTAKAQADAAVAELTAARRSAQARAQAQVDTATQEAKSRAAAAAAEGNARLDAQLAQADLNLSYTRVVAPQDGWVTKRNVELGTYMQPGQQVMALVSPQVWVTANFKETQLNRIRPGQKVAISVDAYPDLDLQGHVDSIQHGSGSKFSAFPAENATGNFVKIVQRVPVKIVIDSGLKPDEPLPLGVSVVPTVTLK